MSLKWKKHYFDVLVNKFTIDGNKFSVSYNNVELTADESGQISTCFEDLEVLEDVILKITAKEAGLEDISLESTSSPNNPEWLYLSND